MSQAIRCHLGRPGRRCWPSVSSGLSATAARAPAALQVVNEGTAPMEGLVVSYGGDEVPWGCWPLVKRSRSGSAGQEVGCSPSSSPRKATP